MKDEMYIYSCFGEEVLLRWAVQQGVAVIPRKPKYVR